MSLEQNTAQLTIDKKQNLIFLQRKITEIHEAVESENIRELKNLLDRKKLMEAADRTGLPPFQKAVVLAKMDVVDELVKEFKDALNIQDGVSQSFFRLKYIYTCIYID